MTAPTLIEGVPGLEAIHTLTPPSPWPSFALNANDPMDTGTFDQAFARLEKITGIHDKPDADDPRVNLIFQPGELPLPRFQRGRTITYSGTIVGRSLSEMRGMIAAVRAACANASTTNFQATPAAWYLSVAYNSTYDATGLAFVGYGLPIAFTCDEEQGAPTLLPSAFQRPFDLTFRQSDGRWWVPSQTQSVGWDGATYDGIDGGTSGTLTMPGTAPSEPVFTLISAGDGSATLTFTSEEIGAQLQIVLPSAMADGDKLVVNFGQRTIMYTPSGDDPVNYAGYLDLANTNWWSEASTAFLTPVGGSLLPGTNTLTVTGDSWACRAIPAAW